MKLSKSLLQAMLIAVTTGTIISCEKPNIVEEKKATLQKSAKDTIPVVNITEGCPACGMG
jgi:hypothetical protein